MSRSTKSQFYRYTLRSSAAQGGVCTDRIFVYPVPPENCLTIESIFLHLRLQFDAAISSAGQVLEFVGIANERPLFSGDDPAELKKIDLNIAADGNRRIDIKLDLTSLLNKQNVGFTSLLSADYEVGDQTHIMIKFPNSLRPVLSVATIEICKVDCLYTTSEIR